jgi:hypothetical protein
MDYTHVGERTRAAGDRERAVEGVNWTSMAPRPTWSMVNEIERPTVATVRNAWVASGWAEPHETLTRRLNKAGAATVDVHYSFI